MWFDHVVWFMINYLATFFGEKFPSFTDKFIAYVVWISDTTCVLVRHQIFFFLCSPMDDRSIYHVYCGPISEIIGRSFAGNWY